MPSSTFHNDLYSLLIASVINQTVKLVNPDGDQIEIQTSDFFKSFNQLLGTYASKYKYKPSNIDVSNDKIKQIIESEVFLKFVAFKDDIITVNTVAKTYEASLSNVILTASWQYSKILVKSINDLSTLYRVVVTDQAKTKEPEPQKAEEEDLDLLSDSKESSSDDSEDSDLDSDKEVDAKDDSEESKSEILDIPDVKDEEEPEESEKEVVEEEKAEVKHDELSDEEAAVKESPVAEKDSDSSANSSSSSEDSDSDEEDNAVPEEEPSPEIEVTPMETEHEAKPEHESKKRLASSSSPSVQQRKRFQHIAVNLIDSIHTHRYSSPFLNPVNKKEALDYSEIIYEPKDLKNILRAIKLKADPPEYRTIKELERDIMLMFANCVMYNRSDTDLVELTRSMKDDVRASFKLFEDTEAEMK